MFEKYKIIEDKIDFVNYFITTKEVDAKNREDMTMVLNKNSMNIEKLTSNIQTHSNIVNKIDENNIGQKIEGDALITNLKNVPLLVFTADCVPITLIDTKNKAVGLIHAGWRGTYDKIVKNTLDMMKKEYNTHEKDVIAIIGASIGGCCYEVSEELVEKFNTNFTNPRKKFYKIVDGKYILDLWKVNENVLFECGVEEIINLELCTVCNNDKFYSYRKDVQTPKRIGTVVEII